MLFFLLPGINITNPKVVATVNLSISIITYSLLLNLHFFDPRYTFCNFCMVLKQESIPENGCYHAGSFSKNPGAVTIRTIINKLLWDSMDLFLVKNHHNPQCCDWRSCWFPKHFLTDKFILELQYIPSRTSRHAVILKYNFLLLKIVYSGIIYYIQVWI